VKLDWVLSCRAFSGRGAELDLEGVGVDTFWPGSLPAPIEFAVVLGLRGSRDDFADPVSVEAYLLGPKMASLGDLGFELGPIEFPGGYLPGWEFSYLHPLAISFDANEFGQYSLELYVSDQRATVFFEVREP